eukprot:PhF_6_TR35106/c0_g1_i1/m.51177
MVVWWIWGSMRSEYEWYLLSKTRICVTAGNVLRKNCFRDDVQNSALHLQNHRRDEKRVAGRILPFTQQKLQSFCRSFGFGIEPNFRISIVCEQSCTCCELCHSGSIVQSYFRAHTSGTGQSAKHSRV